MIRPCFALAALVLISGCAADPIPTYAPMNSRDSLALMRARSASVASVSGQGTLVLDQQERGTVRLDIAYVMRPPGSARLRAWKSGQAVLDLTVTPSGVWLFIPDERDADGQLTAVFARTAHAIPDWLDVLWGLFRASDGVRVTGLTQLEVTRSLADRTAFTCEIDRGTLTSRHAEVIDATGTSRLVLTLDDYFQTDFQAGTALWPRVLVATAPFGKLSILTRSIVVNVSTDEAFVPPARARKIE